MTGLQWLNNCRSSHLRCCESRPSAASWLPTRLLDVGNEGCTSWRLCITSEDAILAPSAPYMTLSYRWGPDPHLRLLSSNIASFRQGQPIMNLPVLFRDVIKVSHHFSIRYLWIDSLCIIQDSEEDWEKESLTMQYVYSNSTCNLAASASESPESRLTYKRNLDFIRPGKVQSSLFSDRLRTFYIYDKTYWNRQIFAGPYIIEAGSFKSGSFHRVSCTSAKINSSGSVGLIIDARYFPKAYRHITPTRQWIHSWSTDWA